MYEDSFACSAIDVVEQQRLVLIRTPLGVRRVIMRLISGSHIGRFSHSYTKQKVSVRDITDLDREAERQRHRGKVTLTPPKAK